MSGATTATSDCGQCGGRIEFERSQFFQTGSDDIKTLGQVVDCPHCGKPTTLYMLKEKPDPKPYFVPPIVSDLARNTKREIETVARVSKGIVGSVVIALVVTGLIVTGLGLIVNSTGRTENIMQQIYTSIQFCFGVLIISVAVLICAVERIK